MFTLEQINNQVDAYIKYTGYEMPKIQQVVYGDFERCEAEVRVCDLRSKQYIIYISNIMDRYCEKYQNSVIWHEFTHITDYIKYEKVYSDKIGEILKSFSESHAESIKLRYLLNLSIKSSIGKERRFVNDKYKKTEMGLISANYGNQSIDGMTKFLITGDPYDFDRGMNNFLYMVGYLCIVKRQLRNKLGEYVVSLYPNQYKGDLKELMDYIFKNEIELSAMAYKKILLSSQIFSIETIL